MQCVYCQNSTKVVNSRPQKQSNGIWRRRQCLECEGVFTTIESADLAHSLLVSKGTAVQPFSRDKLFVSVYDSLKHRKTALSDATELTKTIISNLLPQSVSASLTTTIIADTATRVLGNFDKVAQTHYNAFHA